MQLADVFLALGEGPFQQLLKTVSLGRLRTYQLFERFKVRAHLQKLNSETLRKAAPRLWARIGERDEEFAQDLAQSILVSHLDMIGAALDLLGIPNEDGFFGKDLDPAKYLSDGWQQRVWDALKDKHPQPALLFYINHLAWELQKDAAIFQPASA
jgi:hypothetical protein